MGRLCNMFILGNGSALQHVHPRQWVMLRLQKMLPCAGPAVSCATGLAVVLGEAPPSPPYPCQQINKCTVLGWSVTRLEEYGWHEANIITLTDIRSLPANQQNSARLVNNNNRELIECFWNLKVLYNLKKKMHCTNTHNYTNQ